jgi:hypothetical protein
MPGDLILTPQYLINQTIQAKALRPVQTGGKNAASWNLRAAATKAGGY